MKKISFLTLILFALYFNNEIFAQQLHTIDIEKSEKSINNEGNINTDTTEINKNQNGIVVKEKIYEVVDVMPEFDMKGMTIDKFIKKNLQYPLNSKGKITEGGVLLGFVVTKDGQTVNVEVWKSLNPQYDAEAMRVVRMFKWKPGIYKGEKVAVKYTIPISFSF